MMRKSLRSIPMAALLVASAVQLTAGTLVMVLGNPEASAEARAHKAAVTMKLGGCANPERSTVSATAVGVVNGRRETVPLRAIALSEPGMYAFARQWPDQGKWVIQITVHNDGRTRTLLARVGQDGVEYKSAKYTSSAEDLNAMLETAPLLQARK